MRYALTHASEQIMVEAVLAPIHDEYRLRSEMIVVVTTVVD